MSQHKEAKRPTLKFERFHRAEAEMANPKYVDMGDPLGRFIEECGEALAAAGKTVRFGYESVNPDLPACDQETNEDWLQREVEDLQDAIDRLKKLRGWP
jgi:hypothetical protein